VYALPFASLLTGDGHEVQPLPDVRGTAARRWKIRRPAGVTRSFEVIENSVEPPEAVRASNLFAKDDARAALADELEPRRPEVPLVLEPFAPPALRPRLTGSRPRPDRDFVGPPCEPERVRPTAKASEAMHLLEAFEVFRAEIDNAPAVDRARRDVPCFGEVFEPLDGVRFVLIVESVLLHVLPACGTWRHSSCSVRSAAIVAKRRCNSGDRFVARSVKPSSEP
jgi:hypothetical protein